MRERKSEEKPGTSEVERYLGSGSLPMAPRVDVGPRSVRSVKVEARCKKKFVNYVMSQPDSGTGTWHCTVTYA